MPALAVLDRIRVLHRLREGVTSVAAHVRHSSKGKAFRVRQHERVVRDESGGAVEYTEDVADYLDRYDIEVEDIVSAYRTGRSDYKVGNLAIGFEDIDEDEYDEDNEDEEHTILVEGEIFDVNRKSVGTISRILDFENGTVEHESFSIDKEHQGKGIATSLNTNAFAAYYDRLDMDIVNTYATDVGRYAWAMQGFDFKPKELEEWKALFKEYVNLPDTAKQFGYADADTLRINAQINLIKHSWQMATFTVNEQKIGKEYMIKYMPKWNGTLHINPDHDSYKTWQAYRINAKGKGQK